MHSIAEVQGLSESPLSFDSEDSLDSIRISRHLPNHAYVTMMCVSCGKSWKHEIDCGDRLCPRCNANRRGRIMSRYLPIVRSMSHPKFLTLTVPRRSLSEDNVKRIRECFTRLRHRKMWRATAGLYQIEVGTLDDLGMSNLHIHAIIDSEPMSQKALSDTWLEITGDGFIVDIREAKGDRALVNYMTKHLVKMPHDLPVWQHDLINGVLHNTRLVQGFGDLTHVGMTVYDVPCPFCHAVGTVICLDYEPCYDGFFGGSADG